MCVLTAHTAPWDREANLQLLLMPIVLQIAGLVRPPPAYAFAWVTDARPDAGKC